MNAIMPTTYQLETAANGVQYLYFPHLGTPHGFSTRIGGHSAGPFAGLNLGISCGDEEAVVRGNRTLWASALGVAMPIVSLHQVHGPDVHAVEARPTETLYGDAVLTRTPGLPISVFTADCTPILIFDPVSKAVGAVHAGWRGTVAHVVQAAVAELQTRYGANPSDLRAAIGPAIGPCCFEVGHEVPEAARANPWPQWEAAVVPKEPRPHFDLFTANQAQLEAAGLQPEHIFNSRMCTACHPDLFYSWRRDQGQTGRLQAVIVSPAEPQA